jgi:hypothetical protein
MIATGSGFASTVTTSLFSADEFACGPAMGPSVSNVMRIAFAIEVFMCAFVIDCGSFRKMD